MSEAGYTAMEAVAALAILGLALGGLTSGLKVIGVGELATGHRIGDAVAIRTASDELTRLVFERGPFRSDDAAGSFVGDGRSFSFACGAGTCGAHLTDTGLHLTQPNAGPVDIALPQPADLEFRYQGSLSQVSDWPPEPPPLPAPQWQALKAVLVDHRSTGETVTLARITQQQTANCEYDGILQDCRKVGS